MTENRFLLRNLGVVAGKLLIWFCGCFAEKLCPQKVHLESNIPNFLSQHNKGELKETVNERVIKNYY